MASFVQVKGINNPGTSPAFTSAPTNGNVVSILLVSQADLTSVTIVDSNSVSLTQHALTTFGGTGFFGAVYDYTVSGTPTTTYTISGAGGTTAIVEMLEMNGVSAAGTYQAGTQTTSPTVVTIPTVASGGLQGACYRGASNGAATTLTLSNGTQTNDLTSNNFFSTHAVATATASSTCTYTNSSPGSGGVMYADYTASGGGTAG